MIMKDPLKIEKNVVEDTYDWRLYFKEEEIYQKREVIKKLILHQINERNNKFFLD